MPAVDTVYAADRATVFAVFAAHAVLVWSAVCAISAGVAEVSYSANHQFVGVPAAVAPETNVRLVTTSPTSSAMATDFITCVVSAAVSVTRYLRSRFDRR